MTILQHVGSLYSLDTLDSRFTVSSERKDTQDDNDVLANSPGVPKALPGASPSLWGTPEFYVYYSVVFVALLWMFKVISDVSSPSHLNYSKFEHLLSPGWIAGRKVDNSDAQYASFRDNVPYSVLLLVLHPLSRKAYEYISPRRGRRSVNLAKDAQNNNSLLGAHASEADARLNQRVTFDVVFAALYLVALHGVSSLKILAILYTNYSLATKLPKAHVPAVTWGFNIGLLFANELCKGYPFGYIHYLLVPWSAPVGSMPGQEHPTNWGAVLDSYGGLIPRWEILFKITILRLISFNFDFYWSSSRTGDSSLEKKQLNPGNLTEKDRVAISAKSEDYNFRNYLAYTLYAPLYLAGPILSFNDYISQMRYAPRTITPRRTLLYGIRFLICLLCMEIMLHFIYAVAISKSQPAWEIYTPFQLSMLSYFNLHIIWLKLLLPWRFFRFWALADGVDPPENMVRCMSDNYSTFAFWRAWHRSFNRWIVRYMYIPLGGSGGLGACGFLGKARGMMNLLVIFTFVAIWHDISLKLLIWSWLITFFLLPEVLAEFFFPRKRWQTHRTAYRIICGVGGVGNVLMMMAAHLVGFAVGLDGLKGLVYGLVGSYSGIVFLLAACTALFTGVQIMFEIREHELRNGVRTKC